MNTSILTEGIKSSRTYHRLLSRLVELRSLGTPLPLLIEGVSDGALYALTYSLIKDIKKETGKPLVLITGEEKRANKLNEFFKKCLLKSELYTVRDFNFYDMTASHDLEHERLKVLSGVALGTLDVVLATPDALLQLTMPKKRLLDRTISVNSSTPLDVSQFSEALVNLGYTLCDSVECAGQFSVRGFIIDLFPTKCEYVIKGESKKEQVPIRI